MHLIHFAVWSYWNETTNVLSQKLRVLKAKVPYQGIKNGPIGKSSAPVGDVPWYEYKCLLCTICGGNDEN